MQNILVIPLLVVETVTSKRDNNDVFIDAHKSVCFRCLIKASGLKSSDILVIRKKEPLSQKLRYYRGSRCSQCFTQLPIN